MICRTRALSLAIAGVLVVSDPITHAADVIVQPATGSGFVVKDAGGVNERLRVQESGAVSLPAITSAPAQAQSLCIGATGQLGLCGINGGGALLPPGTTNQTVRYDASNALAANDLLQAFSDGSLLATGAIGSGTIPATGTGTRMMWYPAKAAFRVGGVNSSAWDDANVGGYSVAIGQNPVASGDTSVSMGVGTLAKGTSSVALGDRSSATGQAATALGSSVSASADYALASGLRSQASGMYAVAMGDGALAGGIGSLAVGVGNAAQGDGAVAIGSGTVAYGIYSFAMGLNTVTDTRGEYGLAVGPFAHVTGHAGVALGDHATADQDAIALGRNTTALIGSFVFGGGGAPVKNTGTGEFTVLAPAGVQFYSGYNSGSQFTWPGVELQANSGSWTQLSDRNAKDAVRPVDAREVVEKIAALPLSTWHYKGQQTRYRHMGPMAQDFYAAFHLGESDTGIDTIDSEGVALAAIQGLNALLAEKEAKAAARLDEKDREIAALHTELAAQKKEIAAQKTRFANLEAMAGDLAEVKAQLARLHGSAPATVAAVLQQP